MKSCNLTGILNLVYDLLGCGPLGYCLHIGKLFLTPTYKPVPTESGRVLIGAGAYTPYAVACLFVHSCAYS